MHLLDWPLLHLVLILLLCMVTCKNFWVCHQGHLGLLLLLGLYRCRSLLSSMNGIRGTRWCMAWKTISLVPWSRFFCLRVTLQSQEVLWCEIAPDIGQACCHFPAIEKLHSFESFLLVVSRHCFLAVSFLHPHLPNCSLFPHFIFPFSSFSIIISLSLAPSPCKLCNIRKMLYNNSPL